MGKGQNTEKTQELSFLKTLLTGEDDSEILNAKEEKEHAAMLLVWIRQQDAEFAKEFKEYIFAEDADIASLEEH